jgi:hypothetical protein
MTTKLAISYREIPKPLQPTFMELEARFEELRLAFEEQLDNRIVFRGYRDGITDDTSGFLKAVARAGVDKELKLHAGRYLLNEQIPNVEGLRLVGAGKHQTTIVKGFNGILWQPTLQGMSMERLAIDGNNRTGRVIKVNGFAEHFELDRVNIYSADDTPLEFAGACGFEASVSYCRLMCKDPAGVMGMGNKPLYPGIIINDDGANPFYRSFHKVDSGPFRTLFDMGGQITYISHCSTHQLMLRPTCKKAVITSNRIATLGETLVLDGENLIVAHNVVAGPVEVKNTTINYVAGPNAIVSGVIYGGEYTNRIWNGAERHGDKAVTPPSIAAGAIHSEDVDVTGVGMGDFAIDVSYDQDLVGIKTMITGQVHPTVANKVLVTFWNFDTIAQQPNPGLIRVVARRRT